MRTRGGEGYTVSATTGVVPVKFYEYSDALEVHVLHPSGYRGVCRCGWRGKRKPTYMDGYRELLDHKAVCPKVVRL
jgi:hypothetical protein